MKHLLRKGIHCAIVGTLGVVLGACSSQPAPTAAMEILVGNRSELEDLDPHLCTGVAEFRALGSLFEGLSTVDPETLAPRPGVAERWDVTPDGLRYTFHLRDNAKWSNSDAVTADDFVFAWQRMLSPGLATEYAYLLHCLKNAKPYNEGTLADFAQVGVKALDPRTLEVMLESPTPYFLSMQVHFAWFPLHRATVEKFGPYDQRGSKWAQSGNHVGNGAFRLDAWHPDEMLRVVRNEHYWDAPNVKPDAVRFLPISNEQTEERMFRSGEMHLTYSVPMHSIETYQREQPEALHLAPYLQTYYYRFNCTRPPFNDVRVRRAFGMAIDREALAKNVLKAGEAPAWFFTPPNIAGYTCAHKVTHDVAAARALLAQAGYPDGAGFPPVELLYNSAEFDKTMSEAIQQMWSEALGVRVNLINQDYKVYLSSMSTMQYDIARSTWLADVADPINFLECFLTGQGNNRTGFASPEYDTHIQAAYAEPDAAKRETSLQAAERLLLEEAPITPVCFMTQKYLKTPRLKGMKSNPIGYIRWQDLSLEASE